MMLRCAIVDDEPLALSLLREQESVSATSREIFQCGSGHERVAG